MQLPDPDSSRKPAPAPYLRIATEEAFAPPQMLDIYRRLLGRPGVDPGFVGTRLTYNLATLDDARRVRFVAAPTGAVGVATAALPVLIGLNLRGLKLRAPLFEIYNFALVLLLPLAAAQLEQVLAQTIVELDMA